MKFLLVCAVVLWPSAAFSQDSRLVDACILATSTHLVIETFVPTLVHDFSEMSPPTIKLRVSPADTPLLSDMIAECQFSDLTTPLKLTKFCLSVCLDEDIFPGQFAQITIMLKRAGF